jgi:hypothetical protein
MNTPSILAHGKAKALQVMRGNLTPPCVYRRKGFRGNRAIKRLMALCFELKNGRYNPTSATWKSWWILHPNEAEFYAADFARAYRLRR